MNRKLLIFVIFILLFSGAAALYTYYANDRNGDAVTEATAAGTAPTDATTTATTPADATSTATTPADATSTATTPADATSTATAGGEDDDGEDSND